MFNAMQNKNRLVSVATENTWNVWIAVLNKQKDKNKTIPFDIIGLSLLGVSNNEAKNKANAQKWKKIISNFIGAMPKEYASGEIKRINFKTLSTI